MFNIMIRFSIAGALFGSGLAQAAYTGPLMVKEASTGFTPREYAKTQACAIHAQKTTLTQSFAWSNLKSVETKNQILQGDYSRLIQKASEAKLIESTGAVDGPTVRYIGYLIAPDDSVKEVVFYSENGGSGQILTNPSSEALILRNIIESLCPNTMRPIGH